MPLFGKKPESYVGVDFGAGGIKMVELYAVKGRPQLWTYGLSHVALDIHIKEKIKNPETPVNTQQDQTKKPVIDQFDDPRIDTYAQYLKSTLEEARVTTRKATASLPVSYVFHAAVTLPVVPDNEIEHHINAKVKKLLPRPIEEMQIVYQKVPEVKDAQNNKFLKILVTAAPKDLVTFYTAIFQKAGLELMALETEAFALERSLVGADKTTSMIVDIGAERTNFLIIDQGLPITHRSSELGGNNIDAVLQQHLGVGQDEIGQVKRDVGRLPQESLTFGLFGPILEPIAKEIKYSFDLFLSQTGNENKRPEKIILTGGSSMFPPIQQYLAQTFPLKVFVGDPWGRVVYQQKLKPVLDSVGPRMSVCIGLAMRNIVK